MELAWYYSSAAALMYQFVTSSSQETPYHYRGYVVLAIVIDVYVVIFVTGFAKTVPNGTRIEITFIT